MNHSTPSTITLPNIKTDDLQQQLEWALASIERIGQVATTGTSCAVAHTIAKEAVAATDGWYATLWTINTHLMQVELTAIYHTQIPDWEPPHRILALDETSFIGFVAWQGKPLHVQNVDEAERFLRWDRGARSVLCIPLLFNQHVLAILYVASDILGSLTHAHQLLLERLAPHAAMALHNARMRDIRQKVIEFQHNISNVLPLAQQLDQILERLEQHVDVSGFFLAMYNTESNEIIYPIVFDQGMVVDQAQKHPGTLYGPRISGTGGFGFVEWVLQHRTTLLVENFATSLQRVSINQIYRRNIKSCVVVPLIYQQQIVGVIGLRSYYASRGHFDEYDQHFMEGIADQVAIILNNSKHYDLTQHELAITNRQLEMRIRELRAVSEFQRRISDIDEEAKEIQNIYNVARDAMKGIGVDVSNMYIALYDEQAQTIAFPLAYENGQPIAETAKQDSQLYARTTFGEHRSVAEWIMRRWQKDHIRSALLIEANFRAWIQEREIRPFPTNTKCWLGAPMVYKEKLLGMIGLRNPHREYAFKTEHKELIETIASQAAVAIENARLYHRGQREVSSFRALHEAGKTITRAGLALGDVLQALLEQAVAVTGSFFGTMQLADEDALEFVAAWPKSKEAELQQRYGRMPLTGGGITVRAARLNDAQLVPDVRAEADYIDATGGATGSALAVVLRHGGDHGKQPLGVLNVEHREIGGLTMRDRSVLIGLANLAVVAVENAQNADQLSRSNALAVMGAWGADIVHDIQREVSVIRLALDSLRIDLAHSLVPRKEQGKDPIAPELLQQRLDEIDESIKNLVMPPLPEETDAEGVTSFLRDTIPIDRVIEAEVIAMRARHGEANFQLQTSCPGIGAQIHEQWLRRLLRHLVVNCVRANQDHAQLEITIGTAIHNGKVEVWVEDNGHGIRPEIEHYLFHRPVPHAGVRRDERHGRGLLLVRHIVELHNGKVWLKSNEVEKGACIAFTIPRVIGEETV